MSQFPQNATAGPLNALLLPLVVERPVADAEPSRRVACAEAELGHGFDAVTPLTPRRHEEDAPEGTAGSF